MACFFFRLHPSRNIGEIAKESAIIVQGHLLYKRRGAKVLRLASLWTVAAKKGSRGNGSHQSKHDNRGISIWIFLS